MRRALRASFTAAVALFAAACGASSKAPSQPGARAGDGPGSGGIGVGGSDLPPPKFGPGPWAASLAAACTPSGPEQCFNAMDDNCNGVIDEGCGVCTGPLQFTVAWSEANANVDLVVIDPSGTKVTNTSGSGGGGSSGFRQDRDCPKDGCGGQNVDNVCLEAADPPRGRYVVEIHLGAKAGAVTPPTKVRIGVRVGDKSYGAELELSPLNDQEAITFTL